MRNAPALLLTFGLLASCEQYHPTAPDHIRPASEEDKRFATKVGEEKERRKIINKLEARAGTAVEPMLEDRPGFELERLLLTGPVGIAEGSLDGRTFGAVYWVRDKKIIKRREFVGAAPADPDSFRVQKNKRLRGPGDLQQLRHARAVVAAKRPIPDAVEFRDGQTGAADGGSSALRERIGKGQSVIDGWSVGVVAVVLTEDALWSFVFDDDAPSIVTRYANGG